MASGRRVQGAGRRAQGAGRRAQDSVGWALAHLQLSLQRQARPQAVAEALLRRATPAKSDPELAITVTEGVVGAFLAYETLNERWRLSLNGENLTDETYLAGALYSAGLRMSPGFLNPPRRFSLSLRYRY